MSDTAFIAIPIVIGLIAGIGAWYTTHRRAYRVYWTVFAIMLLISAGLYGAAVSASGWDGIAYLMLMIGGSLPAAAAHLIGGGVGLGTRKRLMLPS